MSSYLFFVISKKFKRYEKIINFRSMMLMNAIIKIIELCKGENVMLDEFFFSNVLENCKNYRLLNDLKKFSAEQLKQVYVINTPLGERKYEYEYKD